MPELLAPGVLVAALMVVGVLLLAVLVVLTLRNLRRFSRVRAEVTEDVQDRIGHLKARSAALKVGLSRRRPGAVESPGPVE